MTSESFVARAIAISKIKTAYLWGAFGAQINNALIDQKANQYHTWYTAARVKRFRGLVGKGYFAFDCVGLIKAILWGWVGSSAPYGGAKYTANKVPDVDANIMMKMCKNQSMNFEKIKPAEVVWMQGHIGIYIGSGKVIECTPAWDDGVQMSACLNIKRIDGLNGRVWTSHGELPWVDYSGAVTESFKDEPTYLEILSAASSNVEGWERVKELIKNDATGKYFPELIVKIFKLNGRLK